MFSLVFKHENGKEDKDKEEENVDDLFSKRVFLMFFSLNLHDNLPIQDASLLF
jgi:hypothetical protein